VHGFLVIALILLTIAGIYKRWQNFQGDTQRFLIVFLALALGQGLIGYLQYLLGVPEALVALHLLGSSIIWIAAWRIYLTQFYIKSSTETV
jgi:cytochrome c oxidase assembly protein subunit 15